MSNNSTAFSIDEIYINAQVEYFHDGFKNIIKEIIKELYYSNSVQIQALKLNHLDRALYKYRIAKEKTCIYNTKQYFKACILSAILESALDEIDD